MKRNPISLTLILATALVLALLSLANPAQAAGYTLACKPGDRTAVHWHRPSQVFAAPRAYFYFSRTSQGHDDRPVRANQCAWLDRRVRPNEPARVCLNGIEPRSLSFETRPKLSTDGKWIYDHLATNWNLPNTTKERKTINALYDHRTFRIRVYNDSNGCLQLDAYLGKE